MDNCRCEQRGVNDVEPSESILQTRPDIYLTGDLDLDSDSPEPGSDTDNELLYPTSNLVVSNYFGMSFPSGSSILLTA